MKPSKKFSVKPLVLSSLTAFVLAACGGGGSGSGTAPPSGEIDLGIDSSGSSGDLAVLPLGTEIRFTLDESLCAVGASCTNVQQKLTAKLNDVEIKDLFTFKGNVASVNAYQLQGLIGEQNEKNLQSTLSIGVKGSGKSPASSTFRLDLSPQVVLLKSTKDTSANFFDATCDGLLTNLPESVLASECKDGLLGSYLNKNAVNLEVKGIYRHDYLSSIKQVQGVGAADVATRPEFKVTGFQYAEGASKGQADFSFEVTGKNSQTNFEFAVPGKELTDMLAAHVNEVKGDHVISQWINDAVVAYVEENLDAENPNGWMSRHYNISEIGMCRKIFETGFSTKLGDDGIKGCTFSVGDVVQADEKGEVSFKFDSSMTFQKELLSVKLFDSAWNVLVNAQLPEKNKLVFDVLIYGYTGIGCNIELSGLANCQRQAVGVVSFDADPIIGARLDLGKPSVGNDLLSIYLDYKQGAGANDSFSLQHNVKKVNLKQCQLESDSTWSGCNDPWGIVPISDLGIDEEINKSVGKFVNDSVKCLLPYTVNNPLELGEMRACKFVDDANEVVYPQNPLKRIGELQAKAVKDDNKMIISAIESQLTDADFATNNNTGFVNLTGWHKTADHGVINNLVGVPFVATGAGAVKSKNLALKLGEDIKIAVSNNWLNQVLLSAYQSDQLKYKIDKEPLENLGDLGKELVAMGGGYIESTDTLTANIKLDAAPYVRFIDGKVELIANAVKFDAELSTDTSGCHTVCSITLNKNGKPYLSVEVSVKALLDIDVNDAVNPIKVSKENLMVHITQAEGTKLIALGNVEFDASNRGMLLPPIYAFMHEQLQDVLTNSWKPMQSTNEICMNNAMVDKFFPKDNGSDEGERVLRIKASSFDTDGKSHLIIGANLTDGKKPDATKGLEVLNITLKHKNSCL